MFSLTNAVNRTKYQLDAMSMEDSARVLETQDYSTAVKQWDPRIRPLVVILRLLNATGGSYTID